MDYNLEATLKSGKSLFNKNSAQLDVEGFLEIGGERYDLSFESAEYYYPDIL